MLTVVVTGPIQVASGSCRKQPRRWRQEATSDDLGSEKPSEAGQTPANATSSGDQPRTPTTKQIDLRAGEWRDKAPAVMAAASERGLNTPKPLVGSGFDVTSDFSIRAWNPAAQPRLPVLSLDQLLCV